jgi:squalene-hopene/tetraprenyl-beta-curcumene cyclase
MIKPSKIQPITFVLLVTCVVMPAITRADDDDKKKETPTTNPVAIKAQAAIDKGLLYLKSQQKPDGSWQGPGDPPAVSALALKAFMQDSKYDADQPFLEKGFDKLLSYQKPEGGIYEDLLANYNTAIAISAIAASKEGEYQPALAKALAYLRRLQWTDKIDQVPERMNVPADDPRYGGFGYGKRERPDGSNLQIALDALHDAGVKPDDPAYKAAVAFETHLQNHSETNNQPWAGNDGGFIYTDADGGNSPAGEYTGPDGRKMFRSYGSMTYGGLKSMIYAGLSKDDPRVKAAWDWIIHNWTFDENPGIKNGEGNTGESGVYYYYHTASRALHAYGEPIVADAQGTKHDWRQELVDKITSLQQPDGSWVGQNKWMENNSVIATSLAILSLQEAKADLNEHAAK